MNGPRYPIGASVRVLDLPVEGHMRVPTYVRGKTGLVERHCGPYLNPERLAYGHTDGPAVQLYQVEFSQADLWESYAGPESDRLYLELYEHWLEPVSPPEWSTDR
jgi:nitrile hydratase